MTSDLLTDRRTVAEHRLTRILTALSVADEELVAAYEARDWEAFGCKTWEEYCEQKLRPLRMLRLSKDAQTEKFTEAARQGLSTHATAAAYGVSQGTVRNRLKGAQGLPDTVKSRDGIVRPRVVVRTAAVKMTKTDRVVAYLVEHGPADVKAVTRMLKCERHEASATLSRLEDQRRITYSPPAKRGSFGTYSAGE